MPCSSKHTDTCNGWAGNSAIAPFFESVFLNLLSYYEFMIQQTTSQQCFLCWAKKELFVHPAMFPHLPEHLASRYVILYACVTMVLDSTGPTCIIKFKSMSLEQKQTAQINNNSIVHS